MAKQSSSSRKQPQQRVNPLRWRTLPPFMKRRILSGYVVLVVLIFGVYVCATNYGYWFGNKTRDGFRIDREAPVVTQAGYEEVPAPDGDHTLYVPEVRTLTLTPNQLDQTLEIGNHPDSVYFLAYVISVPVLQGDTEVLYCPKSYPNTNPFAESQSEQPVQKVHMEARAVYSFAVHALSGCISRVSEAAGGFPQHYVCHQANARILQAAAKQLGEPMDKFFLDIADYGNTSAASIAIALDDCVRSGGIQRGESLILAGFGGGLSYGAAYLTF